MKVCSIEGCGAKHQGKGLCVKHYGIKYRKEHKAEKAEYFSKRYCQDKQYYDDYYQKNKDRSRNSSLVRAYNLTLEQYDAMFAEQEGKCYLCGLAKRLAVDHNHTTGKVRRLLCSECNTGLGKFNDDPALLQKALDYLEIHLI